MKFFCFERQERMCGCLDTYVVSNDARSATMAFVRTAPARTLTRDWLTLSFTQSQKKNTLTHHRQGNGSLLVHQLQRLWKWLKNQPGFFFLTFTHLRKHTHTYSHPATESDEVPMIKGISQVFYSLHSRIHKHILTHSHSHIHAHTNSKISNVEKHVSNMAKLLPTMPDCVWRCFQ